MKIRGRGIVEGRAAGTALVSPTPFSFVGGADLETGRILDPSTGAEGLTFAGRVFAFPRGKGSTVGSYVLYGLVRRGRGPAAIVNETADAVVSTGAILADIPMVDRIDLGALAPGDRVVLDGTAGTVDLPDVRERPVVTVFLRNRGRILIVRRGRTVGSFPGRWSAISGYLERGEDPRDRALQEVFEETGLRGVRVRASGRPFVARDGATAFVVHSFLIDAPRRRVRLNWENVEARWIRPQDLGSLRTVPRLEDGLTSVLSRRGEGAGTVGPHRAGRERRHA